MSNSLWNQEKANQLIPEYMHDGLRLWIEEGIEPGSFLSAVLENNLSEAVGRADMINVHRLKDYVMYLYNFAPSGCWGSPAKVAAWAEKRRGGAK